MAAVFAFLRGLPEHLRARGMSGDGIEAICYRETMGAVPPVRGVCAGASCFFLRRVKTKT